MEQRTTCTAVRRDDVVERLVKNDELDEVSRDPGAVQAGMNPDEPLDGAVAAELDAVARLATRLCAAAPGDEHIAHRATEVLSVDAREHLGEVVRRTAGAQGTVDPT